ncbi:hypothetical protein [Methanobrevibacter curvatus]|uniref:CARDB domain-containing protein n=1 Tax=Methanobrevibacter curvatus TaxID=49547 RepID=A0A166CUD9_9EURY|nr:hypothetical protein [Methanobrevibacter curvatus]KZX14874.1 hypothetical protein MBCUR_03630 [Methanobrevibacter curvatus]
MFLLSISSASAMRGDGLYEIMKEMGQELPDGTSFNLNGLNAKQVATPKNSKIPKFVITKGKPATFTVGVNEYTKVVKWNVIDANHVKINKTDNSTYYTKDRAIYTHNTRPNTSDSLTLDFKSSKTYFISIDFLDDTNTGYRMGFMFNLTVSNPVKKADLRFSGAQQVVDKKGNVYAIVLNIKNFGNADTTYKAKLSSYGKKYLGYSIMSIKYKGAGKIKTQTLSYILKPIKAGKTVQVRIKYPQTIPKSLRKKILRTLTLNVGNYITDVTTNNVLKIQK